MWGWGGGGDYVWQLAICCAAMISADVSTRYIIEKRGRGRGRRTKFGVLLSSVN